MASFNQLYSTAGKGGFQDMSEGSSQRTYAQPMDTDTYQQGGDGQRAGGFELGGGGQRGRVGR